MSDGELWKKILSAKAATLPLADTKRLLDEVATSIASSEQDTAEPHGSYVARHLGALIGRIDLLESDSEVMAGALPGGEPMVQLGNEMFIAKTAMREEFGDPQLQGMDTPLNPDLHEGGLEAAYYAQEAAGIVERHVGIIFTNRP